MQLFVHLSVKMAGNVLDQTSVTVQYTSLDLCVNRVYDNNYYGHGYEYNTLYS